MSGCSDLYRFWGDRIYCALAAETDCIINLASKEYAACVVPYRQENMRIITCLFGELQSGKLKQKGTQAKMARGEMVRYMAENQVEDPLLLQKFDRLNYVFAPELSDAETYVFVQK